VFHRRDGLPSIETQSQFTEGLFGRASPIENAETDVVKLPHALSYMICFEEPDHMTHIVAEPCFNCKYTDCVVVCPVECFYEGEQILVIHPDECIDCEACVPECPVEAIFHEDNLPEQWAGYTELNAEMATQWPVITEQKTSLAETGGECPNAAK